MPRSAVVPDLSAIEDLRGSPVDTDRALDSLAEAASTIVNSLADDGTLFVTGNGGSMADALHIAGELTKAFERPRPLPADLQQRLRGIAGGDDLADHLQGGLRVVAIGADPVLSTAVDNDIELRFAGFAQHLVALARPRDVLVTISTSGRSANVTNAARVAKAIGMPVVLLTGSGAETPLSELADTVVRAPSTTTAEIQGLHGLLYHALCRVLEDTFYAP
jgi:phosphoheptose isomerase